MYQYFIKVVPTTYESLNGNVLNTNQYSVTEHFKPLKGENAHGLPGVFFMYELSPIMVKFSETRKSFAHFLTSLCAIVGGVFTVAGMVDSVLYQSMRSLQKKIDLGKANWIDKTVYFTWVFLYTMGVSHELSPTQFTGCCLLS